MQFGIFSVGDVTPDPTTGRVPSEHERITAMVTLARKAEEVGLDVFATGEHHNPPFVPSSPTTLLGHIAAQTSKLILSTSTTLITTNDPVKIAEDFAMLQHLADGRVDLMMGRGNTGPVYPWFGQDIRQGIPLAIENYALLRKLWREDVVDWSGKFRTPLPVGSPQEVIDKTLTFREHFGDYQRQLFLMDHAGLPLKTVLEQLDLLGEQVIPVLRKELDSLRPAHVPEAPTHSSLKAVALVGSEA